MPAHFDTATPPAERTTIWRDGLTVREVHGRVAWTRAGVPVVEAVAGVPVTPRAIAATLATEPRPSLPFVAGSPTSHSAALSMQEHAGTQEGRVLAFIASRKDKGSTCDELETALGLAHQSAGARIAALCKATPERPAAIAYSGRTRPTRSGRAAGVLVLADLATQPELPLV